MLTTDALQLPRHETQPARPPLRNSSYVHGHLRLLGHPPRHAVPHALRGQSQRPPNVLVGPPRGLLRPAVCPEHARVLHRAPGCSYHYFKPLGLDAGMRWDGSSDIQRAFRPYAQNVRVSHKCVLKAPHPTPHRSSSETRSYGGGYGWYGTRPAPSSPPAASSSSPPSVRTRPSLYASVAPFPDRVIITRQYSACWTRRCRARAG